MTPAPRRTPRPRRIGGVMVLVDDDQPTFWDRVEAGRWEPGTLAALAPLLRPGVLFLDLGAWTGPLSLLAAAQGARVLAVEADPAAQDQFCRNVAANPALAERIELVTAAVAPKGGTVRLGARRKPGDSMSSVLLGTAAETWEAPAVTPAMLAARIGDAPRLVVKIDLEGAEYALLPHLGPLLDGPEVSVLVSLHPVILAASGAQDIEAATRTALAPFAGWRARPVGDAGSGPDGPAHEAMLGAPEIDTWLLTRS